MSTHAERALILEMIEKGTVTPQEGARLIRALPRASLAGSPPRIEHGPADTGAPADTISDSGRTSTGIEADLAVWKGWWIYPLWVGVTLSIIGAGLVYLAMQRSGLGLWFTFAWLPFWLGLALILIAWYSRTAPWLYLRVTHKPTGHPGVIAFGMPLPLGLAAWFLRSFGDWLPGLDAGRAKELAEVLQETLRDGQPYTIHIDSQDDQERVEVWIG